MRGPGSGCCFSCDLKNSFDAAAGLLKTLAGQLVRGPLYSDQIAPAYPQPHRTRDGIPFTGLIPTTRINAPSNPELTLNPVSAVTWYLRAIPRKISAPRRREITTDQGKKFRWMGRSG